MSDQLSDAALSYNTPDFAVRIPTDLTVLGKSMPAQVGAPAPEFELPFLDGGTFRLADARDRRHVVVMTVAITSPMAVVHIPAMNALWKEFQQHGVDFYLLYVKESHPAENYRHHTSAEQKISHARAFLRFEAPAFPILVDGLDGAVHRVYGPWPSALFVIHKNGLLVFRSTIADPPQLRYFLGQLITADGIAERSADRVPHIGYTEYIVEHEPDEAAHHRVYQRAGQKAFEDYWIFHPVHRDRWPGQPAERV